MAILDGVGRRGKAHTKLSSAISDEQPLVLVSDDADEIDSVSPAANQLRAERGSSSWRLTGVATDTIWASSELPNAVELSPDRMDAAAVRMLLEQKSGHRVTTHVAERLRKAAGGNPLVLRDLAAQLTNAELCGLEPLPIPLPITTRVANIYREQLDMQSPAVLAAISMYSYVESIGIGPLAVAMGGLGQVEQLTSSGLLVERAGKMQLSVPIIAVVAARMSTIAQRSVAARRLAEASDGDRALFAMIDHEAPVDSWLAEATSLLCDDLHGHTSDKVSAIAVVGEQRALGHNVEFGIALAQAYGAMGAIHSARRVCESIQTRSGDQLASEELLKLRLCQINTSDGEIAATAFSNSGLSAADRCDLHVARAAALLLRGERQRASADLDAARALSTDVPDPVGQRLAMIEIAGAVGTVTIDGRDFVRSAFDHVERRLPLSPGSIVVLARAMLALGHAESARTLLGQCRVWEATELERVIYTASLAELEAWTNRPHHCLELVQELDETLPAVPIQGIDLSAALILSHAATGKGELLERYAGEGQPMFGRGENPARALALGYQHLVSGRYQAAIDLLQPMVYSGAATHLHVIALDNLIEALVASNQIDEARREEERARTLVARLDDSWARSRLLRCAALVARSSRSDDAFAEAITANRTIGGYGLMRTFVAHGRVLRLTGRTDAATSKLGRAAQLCGDWGMNGWIPEIERLRDHVPAPSASDLLLDDLTASERQIVQLVTLGLRNREVAAKLFVSLRTVEAALTRIYRKVHVANRSELIARACRTAS